MPGQWGGQRRRLEILPNKLHVVGGQNKWVPGLYSRENLQDIEDTTTALVIIKLP